MHRAEKLTYTFCVLAALAGSALVVPRKRPKAAMPLAIIVLAFSAGTFAVSGWIAHAGGKIRHPEFRVRAEDTSGQGEGEMTRK